MARLGRRDSILRQSIALAISALVALAPLTASAGEARALLWRFEREGVAPSYLFGTIHLSLPDIVDVSPAVRAAILAAEVTMGEGIPRAPFELSYMQALHGALPHEQVERALEPELLDRLVAAAECYGMSDALVRQAPLWFVVPYLTLMLPQTARAELARQLGGAKPLDEVLARIAADAGKLTLWIESPSQQIDFFRSMPREDVIGMLREVAALDACPPDDAPDPVLDFYRARDLDGMLAYFETWLAKTANPDLWRRFEEVLLVRRNRTMAARIDTFARANSIFVAVGAGHLPREDGLIALLRARGWTVEPVE